MRPTKTIRKNTASEKKIRKIVQKILQCILSEPNPFNKIVKNNNNKIIRPNSDRQKNCQKQTVADKKANKNCPKNPCETVPKIGNVWERGGTWHNGITIHHAFQNAKRIRKWYSTVLLLYFLPVHILLLSSCLAFAFCVFLMMFDIFWFRYSCILCVLWPMSISDHKVVNITVLKKRFLKPADIFSGGWKWILY